MKTLLALISIIMILISFNPDQIHAEEKDIPRVGVVINHQIPTLL